MFLVRPPALVTKLFFNLVWNIPNEEKNIYLTFDDGPIPETTPIVLDTLDEFGVKATFFCVGENVAKYPDLFQEIRRRGHTVGNHTYNHLNGWKTETAAYIENIERANQLINASLFRPPYGKITQHQKSQVMKQFKIVMWDVLSRDYDLSISREECLNNVLTFTKPGSVIVFHDSIKARRNMTYVVPRAIETLLHNGYHFRPITCSPKPITAGAQVLHSRQLAVA